MAGVVRDTLGTPVAEGGVLVTLRADLPGGISLGGDASIEPGETKRVPAHLALQLIHTGRAVRVVPPKAAVVNAVAKDDPGSSAGVASSPAPAATRKKK